MKFYLIGLLLLISSVPLFAQNPVTITLSAPDNGQKVYVAQDNIRLNPGYSYTGTSNNMRAYIEKHTPYQSLYNTTTFDAQAINTSLPVGAIDGSHGVSAVGGASYSIPIKIPYGTNGLMPQLSVQYNSLGGNGLLGRGWDLTGLSAISVVQSTWYQDGKTEGVTLNGTDFFALDGNRLHVTSGTNGGNNSIYTTEGEQFFKITSYTTGTGPEWFKVETKDGITMEFGNSTDSRLKSKYTNAYISWRINKVYDTYGNYMVFTYRNENNDSRIDKIEYTGNTTNGVLPYNLIQFVYETRNDVNSTYLSGTELTAKTLLSKIVISSDGVAYKSYEFGYGDNDYTYLNSVTEIGSDGTKLNPTVFQYGNRGVAFQNQLSSVSQDQDNFIASTADYNGDGKQDILLYSRQYDGNGVLISTGWEVKVSTGDNAFAHYANGVVPNGYVLFFVNGAPHFKNPAIGSGFDFFGDGKDDLLFVAYNIDTQDPDVLGDDLYSNARFIIQSINGLDDLAPSYEPSIISGGYIELSKFLKIGDFDGDGRDDILYSRYSSPSVVDYSGQMITAHSGAEVVGYNSSGLQYMFSANNSLTTDTDGDGKVELMLTYTGSCEVWEFNRGTNGIWTNTKILHSTDFNNYNKIVPGDFNGDGKTDLLHYTSLTWRIGYSTGAGFNVKTTPVTGNPTYYYDIGNSVLKVGDYNGDGISDVFCIYTNYIENQGPSGGLLPYETQVDVYHFLGFNYNGTPKVRIQSNTFSLHSDYNRIYEGDYNGDGRTELIVYKTSGAGSWLYSYDKNGDEYLLKRVKNGYGNVVSFDYRWMSKGDNYTMGSSATWPLNDGQFGIPLVYSVSVPNGIGGVKSEIYAFEGAKIHRQGKGFLGFTKVISSNASLDMSSTQEFELKVSPYLLLLKKETVNVNSSGAQVSEKTYTNQLIATGVRYKVHVTGITENSSLNTITKTTTLTYDNYGNNLETTVTNGVETVVNQFTYTAFGTWWIPSRVASNTTTTTRSGEVAFSKTSNFTYNTKGGLLTEVNYPSTSKTTTTTYTYDNFGNNTLKSLSATGLATVTVGSTFDAKGRFAILLRNPLNQETELQLDKRWGDAISRNTPDGLVETSVFDAFGRLLSSVNSKGITSTVDLQWDIASGTATPSSPQNTLYSIKKETAFKPYTKVWYDVNGRAVIEEAEEMNGIKRIVTNYTANGQVLTKTSPFFSGSTPVYVTYTYDTYGRVLTSTNGVATSTSSYSASGGQNTVAVTSPTGNSSKTFDASGKVISSTDNGGTLTFQYYSSGLQKQIALGGIVTATMEYDICGNQTKLTDADGGVNLYSYDAFGRLVSQTDANGNQYQMLYDVMSRETSRTGPDGTTTITYVTAGNGLNNQKRVTSPNGVYIENDYDMYGQVTVQTEFVDGVSYVMNTEYDYAYDRIKSMTYPSGYKIRFYYDGNSNVTSVKNDAGTVTMFSSPVKNALGQYTQYTLGNGKVTQKTYDNYGYPLITYANGVQNLETNFSQSTGNLTNRKDYLKNRTESFDYDANNRLTESVVSITSSGLSLMPLTIDYANNGNITEKTDAGVYQYDANKIHAVTSVDNPGSVISSLQQDVTYTPFDRTATISEGTKLLTFTYGPDLNRVKTIQTNSGSTVKTKYFFGAYEKEVTPTYTREIHYIPTGNGSEAVYVVENGVGAYYYLYKDHLGSVLAVTNAAGAVTFEQNFDAWGRRRDVATWSYTTATPPATYSWVKGYTGHEQLDDFGLINMNNRMYDPVLGRMLAVDNYVSDPLSSQNYNRYSYVLNNPLKFTDPNGEFPWLAVGAVLLFTTDIGYEVQKFVSPVAVQLDIDLGTHGNGLGLNISFGMPQSAFFSYRGEFGATYYFNRVGGYGSGWQLRVGAEWGLFWGFVRYGGIRYLDFGKGNLLADQVVHTAKVGIPGFSASYSNDTEDSFPWARFVPFIPKLMESNFNSSGSDRLRTASAELTIFGMSLGMFLHTGEADGFTTSEINGNETTYFSGGSINDPSKSNGIYYAGMLGFKIGVDSEQIRHFFQNRLAHDGFHLKYLKNNTPQYGQNYPWILKVDRKDRLVFQFGSF